MQGGVQGQVGIAFADLRAQLVHQAGEFGETGFDRRCHYGDGSVYKHEYVLSFLVSHVLEILDVSYGYDLYVSFVIRKDVKNDHRDFVLINNLVYDAQFAFCDAAKYTSLVWLRLFRILPSACRPQIVDVHANTLFPET